MPSISECEGPWEHFWITKPVPRNLTIYNKYLLSAWDRGPGFGFVKGTNGESTDRRESATFLVQYDIYGQKNR
jgi:hypothetical protein